LGYLPIVIGRSRSPGQEGQKGLQKVVKSGPSRRPDLGYLPIVIGRSRSSGQEGQKGSKKGSKRAVFGPFLGSKMGLFWASSRDPAPVEVKRADLGSPKKGQKRGHFGTLFWAPFGPLLGLCRLEPSLPWQVLKTGSQNRVQKEVTFGHPFERPFVPTGAAPTIFPFKLGINSPVAENRAPKPGPKPGQIWALFDTFLSPFWHFRPLLRLGYALGRK